MPAPALTTPRPAPHRTAPSPHVGDSRKPARAGAVRDSAPARARGARKPARAGAARKPAPDGPLRALKLLNVGRDQAIYVGDSPTDVETARNSGLPCLAVSWGFRSRDQLARAGARYIIDSAGQFIKQMQIIERESQP